MICGPQCLAKRTHLLAAGGAEHVARAHWPWISANQRRESAQHDRLIQASVHKPPPFWFMENKAMTLRAVLCAGYWHTMHKTRSIDAAVNLFMTLSFVLEAFSWFKFYKQQTNYFIVVCNLFLTQKLHEHKYFMDVHQMPKLLEFWFSLWLRFMTMLSLVCKPGTLAHITWNRDKLS